MKRILLLILSFIACYQKVEASGETVCIYTSTGSSGQICNPNNILLNPCSQYAFVVNTNVPQGYDYPDYYEWFVNDVLTYTASGSTNKFFNYTIRTSKVEVYCKVYYRNSSNQLSAAQPSNTFKGVVKELSSFQQILGPSSIPCNAGTVTYSLQNDGCPSQYGATCYNNSAAAYEVTWAAPTGWVQTAISNNGRNVTFSVNATGGGTLTATIHLNRANCDFTETRVLNNIQRTTPSPISIVGPDYFCDNANYALNNLPAGASVSWQAYPTGSVTVTAPNSPTTGLIKNTNGIVYLYAVASNVCGNSSLSTQKEITVGPSYAGFSIQAYLPYEPGCFALEYIYVFRCTQTSGQPFTGNYQWGYRIQGVPGEVIGSSNSQDYTFIPYQTGTYEIFVRPVNDCGVGQESVRTVEVGYQCMGGMNRMAQTENTLSIYPNPAKTIINLKVTDNTPSSIKGKSSQAIQIALYDNLTSALVKTWKVPSKQSTYSLDLKGVKRGRYFIKYTNGSTQLIKQVIVD